MERTHGSGKSSGKRKAKKDRGPPADKDSILQSINEIRKTFYLPEITPQEGIENYANMILTDDKASLADPSYVLLSDYHFAESFDGKSTTQQLIKKWLNDSSKRPVLLAPGKRGAVSFIEIEEDKYFVVVVVSIFH